MYEELMTKPFRVFVRVAGRGGLEDVRHSAEVVVVVAYAFGRKNGCVWFRRRFASGQDDLSLSVVHEEADYDNK